MCLAPIFLWQKMTPPGGGPGDAFVCRGPPGRCRAGRPTSADVPRGGRRTRPRTVPATSAGRGGSGRSRRASLHPGEAGGDEAVQAGELGLERRRSQGREPVGPASFLGSALRPGCFQPGECAEEGARHRRAWKTSRRRS